MQAIVATARALLASALALLTSLFAWIGATYMRGSALSSRARRRPRLDRFTAATEQALAELRLDRFTADTSGGSDVQPTPTFDPVAQLVDVWGIDTIVARELALLIDGVVEAIICRWYRNLPDGADDAFIDATRRTLNSAIGDVWVRLVSLDFFDFISREVLHTLKIYLGWFRTMTQRVLVRGQRLALSGKKDEALALGLRLVDPLSRAATSQTGSSSLAAERDVLERKQRAGSSFDGRFESVSASDYAAAAGGVFGSGRKGVSGPPVLRRVRVQREGGAMAGLDSLAGNLADFVTSERSPYEMLLAIPALPQLNSQLKTQLKSTTAKVARAGEKLREKVIAMPATFDGKFSAAVLGEFWRAELLHPAATSDAAEMQYLRRLARAIVGRLLPRSEVQLAALRLLIEELLAVTLLKPLLANLATAQTNRALLAALQNADESERGSGGVGVGQGQHGDVTFGRERSVTDPITKAVYLDVVASSSSTLPHAPGGSRRDNSAETAAVNVIKVPMSALRANGARVETPKQVRARRDRQWSALHSLKRITRAAEGYVIPTSSCDAAKEEAELLALLKRYDGYEAQLVGAVEKQHADASAQNQSNRGSTTHTAWSSSTTTTTTTTTASTRGTASSLSTVCEAVDVGIVGLEVAPPSLERSLAAPLPNPPRQASPTKSDAQRHVMELNAAATASAAGGAANSPPMVASLACAAAHAAAKSADASSLATFTFIFGVATGELSDADIAKELTRCTDAAAATEERVRPEDDGVAEESGEVIDDDAAVGTERVRDAARAVRVARRSTTSRRASLSSRNGYVLVNSSAMLAAAASSSSAATVDDGAEILFVDYEELRLRVSDTAKAAALSAQEKRRESRVENDERRRRSKDERRAIRARQSLVKKNTQAQKKRLRKKELQEKTTARSLFRTSSAGRLAGRRGSDGSSSSSSRSAGNSPAGKGVTASATYSPPSPNAARRKGLNGKGGRGHRGGSDSIQSRVAAAELNMYSLLVEVAELDDARIEKRVQHSMLLSFRKAISALVSGPYLQMVSARFDGNTATGDGADGSRERAAHRNKQLSSGLGVVRWLRSTLVVDSETDDEFTSRSVAAEEGSVAADAKRNSLPSCSSSGLSSGAADAARGGVGVAVASRSAGGPATPPSPGGGRKRANAAEDPSVEQDALDEAEATLEANECAALFDALCAATPSSLYAFLGPFAARQAVAKVHSFMQSEKLMKSLAHSMLLSVLERIFTGIRAEVE